MNKFKLRNFDNHHKDFCDVGFSRYSIDGASGQSFSDSQYDQNKFVTHAFIPIGEDSDGATVYHCFSSVDLAFGSHPSVTSYVPADLRSRLGSSLMSKPSSSSPSLSDDELLCSVPSSFGLERSEIVELTRSSSSYLSPSDTVPADIASADTVPADTAPSD